MLEHAFKFEQNVRLFVDDGGVHALTSLLARLPVHLPHLPHLPQAHDAGGEAEGEAEGGWSAVAVSTLDLLQTIGLSTRRLARQLCCSPHVHRIAHSILCADLGVIGRAVELLSLLCDVQPPLASALHRSGVFRFVLSTIPTSDGGRMPTSAAHFLQRFHAQQAWRPAAPSFLMAYFPPSVLALLSTGSPDELADAIAGHTERPNLYWTPAFRSRLVAAASAEISELASALVARRALLGGGETAAPAAEEEEEVVFEFSEPRAVCYPELESELCVGGTFIRFFVREAAGAADEAEGEDAPAAPASVWHVEKPDDFLAQLILAFGHTCAPTAESCVAGAVDDVGDVGEAGEDEGVDTLTEEHRGLLFEAQRLVILMNNPWPEARTDYPRAGWTALLRAVYAVGTLAGERDGAPACGGSDPAAVVRLCEAGLRLVRVLLFDAEGGRPKLLRRFESWYVHRHARMRLYARLHMHHPWSHSQGGAVAPAVERRGGALVGRHVARGQRGGRRFRVGRLDDRRRRRVGRDGGGARHGEARVAEEEGRAGVAADGCEAPPSSPPLFTRRCGGPN